MEKFTGILVGITAFGLVVGWFMSPAFAILTGIALWFCILLILGGAEDGNPARTSWYVHRGIPDRPYVHTAMKPVNVQKEKNIRGRYVWMLLISGAGLVCIGLYWMRIGGMW